MTGPFAEARAGLTPVDEEAAAETRGLVGRLTKPPGSLGHLEDVAVTLSAISGTSPPPVPEPAAVAVFAGDHGVLAEGVTPWPAEVTAQMVGNFLSGGAAVNVFARHAGARVVVVDVGVASTLHELGNPPALLRRKVRAGTANLAREAAMSQGEAVAALDVGASVAAELVEAGARCLLTGDMGIGNTTPSAAIIAALAGREAVEVTGRGTGVDDEHFERKVRAVHSALERIGAGADPMTVAAEVGGLEIVALAGYIVGAAARRVPVVVDGVIAAAGALLASALAPVVTAYLVAGHRSTEPGASVALDYLGLRPLVDLELRLGEGTGACLALPLLQAAAKMAGEMATFDAAGVSDKT